MFRNTIKYIATFMATVLLLILTFVEVAKIPQSLIQQKMLESGEYYNKKEQIEYLTEGILSTQLHYSADATWMSIAYNLDKNHPLESVMWSYYSLWDGENYNGSFYKSVLNEAPGKLQEYLRYWHGSAAIIRFLHLFLNAKQIYTSLSILVSILICVLVIFLIRNQMLPEAIVLLLSLFLVSTWVVPLCLEYVWMFLIMLVTSIFVVKKCLRRQYQNLGLLFFLTGILSAYFDFLTTETITLLIPLLLILKVNKRQNTDTKHDWLLSIKSCFVWIIGFIGMWVMKWVIASAVLKINVMPYVTQHIEERIAGDVGLALPECLWQAVIRNINRLFIFDYGLIGAATLVLLIVLFLIIPVWKNWISIRKHINMSRILLFLTLGLIPYIRYLVLHNHSYGHYCFTYRAQASSILAIGFIVLEIIEPTNKGLLLVNSVNYYEKEGKHE